MSEFFLDTPQVDLAPADTWPSLSVNQLMDVKTKLENKLYGAGSNRQYIIPLQRGIAQVQELITQKLENPRDD